MKEFMATLGFHWKGALVSMLVLLPNLLYFMLPPRNAPAAIAPLPVIFTILEQAGRVLCFVLPFVFGRRIAESKPDILVLLMGLCLLGYYLCWARFFAGGRGFDLMYAPFLGIPVPLAVFPILYFLLLGVWLRPPVLILPAVLFAVGHLAESLNIWRQIK